MPYAYSWQLTVPVWTPESDFTQTRKLLPQLTLERAGNEPDADRDPHGGNRTLLRIAFSIYDFNGAPPRWVVQDYTAEGFEFDIGEDGKMSSAHASGPNTKAYPRTTAKEAIAVAMKIIEASVDRQTYQSLEKVGALLGEQIERFTKALRPRLKPRPNA